MPKTKYKRRYYYDRKNRVKYLLDEFNEPYYYIDKADVAKTISITLPKSLIEEIDIRKSVSTRSRFIRKLIEKSLQVKRIHQ